MDDWPAALVLGLAVFALNLVTFRLSHRTWTAAIVQATGLGVLYGVGWVVSPIVGRALGSEIVGIIGLIAISVIAALVIYGGLRKEDSRL